MLVRLAPPYDNRYTLDGAYILFPRPQAKIICRDNFDTVPAMPINSLGKPLCWHSRGNPQTKSTNISIRMW